ncbi:serine/threonine-protein kinase [Sorangium sp. So ce131]|uniref:serine/threonine-protein kinase n=1 Tax=Sorangium sp. So ce131 TaxID=3133282 RepID=UPI003F5FBAFD
MQVSPQLRLIRALGQGGMGSVWLAEHVALKTHVAVKFLRDVYMDHPQAAMRLQREAEAAARIQSPHVVRVFDLGFTDQGVPYIVMEHLEGETLQDLVERRTRLSLEETVAIVRQIGAALAKAHEAGVVHRDIKPENIFLVGGEREPFIKVLDFGIAKNTAVDAERLTVTGAIMGTPHFMSPEQMAGGARVGPHSDLWSLGVVTYFCLTGRIPFGGATIAAVAVAIDRGPPPPPSQLAPELPPAIDAWVLSMLQADPARRLQSARAVLESLDAALGAPRDSRPTPIPTERMHREPFGSGEGFQSLVTTLMPPGMIGSFSPRARVRGRTWAMAAAALLGASTLAWAGASGVAGHASAAQSASLAAIGGNPVGALPVERLAVAADKPAERPAPVVEPAAQDAAEAAAAPAPGAQGAPEAQDAQGTPGAARAPGAVAAAPRAVPAAPSVSRAAPADPQAKKVAPRTRARRDLGF